MSSKAQKIGSVLKYSALPEILPRVVELFASGFAHLAYFMAQVYRAVRLLPANHPYLLHSNMGRYSLWNVVGEARRNLVFKWTHLDQLLVFA
ncbi:MAG: hypothetical protein KKA05_04925, partial [Alphaproteobacteria bacterium]|nr:hypothetical protein [Alphaproteobacteria bacterium]